MYSSDHKIFLPYTLDEIRGKSEKEQIKILKDKLAFAGMILDLATAEEIQAISGAPLEDCAKMLKF
jgi:hypothetical protein